MQLLAMYPGGHATLVDYDPFCRAVRFGEFPAAPARGVMPYVPRRGRAITKRRMPNSIITAPHHRLMLSPPDRAYCTASPLVASP